MNTKQIIIGAVLLTSLAVNGILIHERLEKKFYQKGIVDGVKRMGDQIVAEVQKNQAITVKMPDGKPMPGLSILGPGPAYDPLRAAFNQWASEWMRDLGMPVKSELTGFNNILGPVFVDATYDMYILGWSLGNVAFPDYYESFWASWNDTTVSGNNNTAGFNNPDYDAEDRFKRKIVQIDEVVGMDVDPMRGIDWSIARDAIGLKPSVIVEETGRLLCSWTRDAISRKHRGNIRESVRLPPGQPRDEMDNRSGGK